MKTTLQDSFSQLRSNLRAIEAYSSNQNREAGEAIAKIAVASIERSHSLEAEMEKMNALLIRAKTSLKLEGFKADSALISEIDEIVTGKYGS